MDELDATVKPKFKNVLAIAGLETMKNKQGVPYRWSETFMNNVATWIKDNWLKSAGGKAIILDARSFKSRPNPLADLCDAIVTASMEMDGGLDALFYTGHGDMITLYVFSKTQPTLPDTSRFITLTFPLQDYWKQIHWSENPGKGIWLATCRAGGDEGHKWEKCIAQHLATMTKTTTWGFLWRCSQKQRADRGYYQRPDHGSYVPFRPILGEYR